jgi:hypothetical protein
MRKTNLKLGKAGVKIKIFQSVVTASRPFNSSRHVGTPSIITGVPSFRYTFRGDTNVVELAIPIYHQSVIIALALDFQDNLWEKRIRRRCGRTRTITIKAT